MVWSSLVASVLLNDALLPALHISPPRSFLFSFLVSSFWGVASFHVHAAYLFAISPPSLSRAAVQKKLVEQTRRRCAALFVSPHDASVSAGGAPFLLLCAGRLRAEDREHRGRPEPEEVWAGLQRRREPGQPGVRKRQIQAHRDLRNAQAQRHPDGSLRLRGPYLQSGTFTAPLLKSDWLFHFIVTYQIL